MMLTNILIKNYKSIKLLEIEFNSVFGLIGYNNAGKSNVLKAINLVLGEFFPTQQRLTMKDFFLENSKNTIKIEIEFSEDFVSHNEKCNKVLFTAVCLKEAIEAYLYAITSDGIQQKRRLNGQTREKLQIIYIPAERNFYKELEGGSEWSFLGKAMKKFHATFPEDKKNQLKEKFNETKEILETEKFKAFESNFKAAFEKHNLPKENNISIGFKSFNPKSYYKSIQLIPEEDSVSKNIDQIGDGMKNLIFLSLLRAYAKTFPKSSIFLIEEPELFLHPQARSDLFELFKRLAINGSQIIYTTHSQEFINIGDITSIGKIFKNHNSEPNTEIKQIDDQELSSAWRENTKAKGITPGSIKMFLQCVADAETNKAFFSRKIVLVEGITEKWLFEVYCEKEKLNLYQENIEIVNCNGKGNIMTFYSIFKLLGYSIYVIFDGDKKKASENSPEGKNMRKLNKILTSRLFGEALEKPNTRIESLGAVFENDLETELKASLKNFEKLRSDAKELYGLENDKKPIIGKYVAMKTVCPKRILSIIENFKI